MRTASAAPVFAQMLGHRPRRLSPAEYARKELACIALVDDALRTMQAGQLAEFDARVGDTNCQVLTHLVIELALFSPLARRRLVAAQLAKAKTVLDRWTSDRASMLDELTSRAFADGAIVDLSDGDVVLACARFIKRVTRDEDQAVLRSVQQAGGSRGFDRARREVNRITDAHIVSVADATERHWRRIRADILARDISVHRVTLAQAWRLNSFAVRLPYSGLAVLMSRIWQQGILLSIASHVLVGDHQHVECLLYQADPSRPMTFSLVPRRAWATLARAPVMVVTGLSDPAGQYEGLPVDTFYSMRRELPVIATTCCAAKRARIVAALRAIGPVDLVCAGETLRAESAGATGFLTSAVPAADQTRFVTHFERRRRLALDRGLHADDARLFRAVHIYPATGREIGDPLPCTPSPHRVKPDKNVNKIITNKTVS